MKDDLPQLLPPITRILVGKSVFQLRWFLENGGAHLKGVGSFLLRTLRGLLTPTVLTAALLA